MVRTFTLLGAGFAFLAVALGAFGTHGLRDLFEANGRGGTFDTAVQYHMIHALALMFASVVYERWPGKAAGWAGYLFAAGIILFSGALYILAIFDLGFMGAVAPFGGAAFLGGWLCIGTAAWKAGAD